MKFSRTVQLWSKFLQIEQIAIFIVFKNRPHSQTKVGKGAGIHLTWDCLSIKLHTQNESNYKKKIVKRKLETERDKKFFFCQV